MTTTLRPSYPLPSGAGRPAAAVRLGVIDYLNVVPVYDWLLRRERAAGGLPGVETVAGVPAEMNRALLDNAEFTAWVNKRTPAGRWGWVCP